MAPIGPQRRQRRPVGAAFLSQRAARLVAAPRRHLRQGRNLAGELAGLKLPIQVIWGAKDAVIPAAHAKALPNAHVKIIDAAGHMAQMEAASRVNDLIKAQIAG